ncbi:MAG: DUF1801 domain-containing protein [Armatimonadetes bacterium]|nr:DUF1801 domain-containing protein [Armatimonadota bacterium]
MTVEEEIRQFISALDDKKRGEIQTLHDLISAALPGCKLWFSDGRNEEGKIVSNPTIGYSFYTIQYANGSEKEFFRIGLSAKASGISVFIMGLEDKEALKKRIGSTIGKAKVTGYCISFNKTKDIDMDVLINEIKHWA